MEWSAFGLSNLYFGDFYKNSINCSSTSSCTPPLPLFQLHFVHKNKANSNHSVFDKPIILYGLKNGKTVQLRQIKKAKHCYSAVAMRRQLYVRFVLYTIMLIEHINMTDRLVMPSANRLWSLRCSAIHLAFGNKRAIATMISTFAKLC